MADGSGKPDTIVREADAAAAEMAQFLERMQQGYLVQWQARSAPGAP